MRKKIEKNFWDMEMIGNRQKKLLFVIVQSSHTVPYFLFVKSFDSFLRFLDCPEVQQESEPISDQ